MPYVDICSASDQGYCLYISNKFNIAVFKNEILTLW